MTNWTPETNRIPTGLLTPDELAALKAAEHGWEWYERGWTCAIPTWHPSAIYRAKPAPPKRVVSWHNVYPYSVGEECGDRHVCDLKAAKGRICVYRIERDEDGSDPQIFVEEV